MREGAGRTGQSRCSSRVHIFWQKRIRAGDHATPWWFPAKTDAGAMREDRLVLPIPPGLRWSDGMPVIRPAEELPAGRCQLPDKKRGSRSSLATGNRQLATPPTSRQFGGPSDDPGPGAAAAVVEKPKQGAREKKPKVKADPKLVAAARELRDRWLEQVNAGQYVFEDAGKYDVSRALPGAPETSAKPMPLLPAA